MKHFALHAGIVGWPAFLAAGLIETFVFAFVEPAALHALGGGALDLSATAIAVALMLSRGGGETGLVHGDGAPR